jgi:putative NADH-flavin reductase
MKLAILGASGSVGRELVIQALAAGHDVTVLVRHTPRSGQFDRRVTVVQGDADDPGSVDRAVAGSDAVLSALGHAKGSPRDLLAAATSNTIAAMQAHGIRRLVVLASPSVTDQGDRPSLFYRFVRLAMPFAMRAETLDHRAQSRLVRDSGLDWTIVRGALVFTDGPHAGRYQAGPITHEAGRSISRADLADFMLASATHGMFVQGLPFVSQETSMKQTAPNLTST